MITFRKFEETDKDYAIYEKIETAIWGEFGMGTDKFRHENKTRNPKYDWHIVVVEMDGEPIAYGQYGENYWNQTPNEYEVVLLVHPDYQGRGIGRAFEEWVSAEYLTKRPVKRLVTGTRSDKPDAIAFLERRGFEKGAPYNASILYLDKFDPTKLTPIVEKVQAAGLTLQTLAQWQQVEPNWAQKWEELEYILEQDEPHPSQPARLPFDEFVAMRFSGPDYTPETWYLATDGERLAGISMLVPHPLADDMVNTYWTGVDRDYRRIGLATALKTMALNNAKQFGIKRVFTGNHADNPMYTLNIDLGFEPIWTWYEYVLILENQT